MITPLEELKKRPWYPSYPQEIKDQLESYTLPEIPLYRFLESSAKYFPKVAAMIYEPGNFMVNYKDLAHLCERFASGLQNEFGVKKGDRIAIYSRNYPEFLIAHYGILMAGAVFVACNPMLIKDELEYLLNDSQAEIIVISDDMAPVLRQILREKSTGIRKVILFERDHEFRAPVLRKARLKIRRPFFRFSGVFSDKPYVKPEIAPRSDLAAIMYTSGTTGYPKGVMFSHYNIVCSNIQYHCTYTGKFPEIDAEGFVKCTNFKRDLTRDWEYPIRYGVDSAVAVATWTHVMGFSGYLHCQVMAANTIFPLPVFNVDVMLEMIRRWRIAFTGGAPMIMSMLLARSDIDEQDLSPVRAWATGSAPCPVVLGENFAKRISGIITEGYSLTEAANISTKNFCNKSGLRKWGSTGLPLPFVDMKIVDLETGTREMSIGEEGELIQNGPAVTLGYLNKPEDTRESFRNGWLYTGDIAVMDQDGFISITGRKKELIIYKGYNIAPRTLEEIILKHPAVADCAAVGKKDELAGEIPVAFVVRKEGASLSAEEIMKFVNDKVAPYKKVREVRFIDKIPLNALNKVNRRELANLL